MGGGEGRWVDDYGRRREGESLLRGGDPAAALAGLDEEPVGVRLLDADLGGGLDVEGFHGFGGGGDAGGGAIG